MTLPPECGIIPPTITLETTMHPHFTPTDHGECLLADEALSRVNALVLTGEYDLLPALDIATDGMPRAAETLTTLMLGIACRYEWLTAHEKSEAANCESEAEARHRIDEWDGYLHARGLRGAADVACERARDFLEAHACWTDDYAGEKRGESRVLAEAYLRKHHEFAGRYGYHA